MYNKGAVAQITCLIMNNAYNYENADEKFKKDILMAFGLRKDELVNALLDQSFEKVIPEWAENNSKINIVEKFDTLLEAAKKFK